MFLKQEGFQFSNPNIFGGAESTTIGRERSGKPNKPRTLLKRYVNLFRACLALNGYTSPPCKTALALEGNWQK